MAGRRSTICLLAVTATLGANVSLTPQTRTLAITRINVVDVIDGRIVPNSTVTISGDTIVSVTQNGAPPADGGAVDGQGKFLIPGLWDMHAHVEGTRESSLQLYVLLLATSFSPSPMRRGGRIYLLPDTFPAA